MSYSKAGRGKQYNFEAKETVSEVLKYPIKGNAERGIRKEISEKYGIRVGVDTETGKDRYYYFPSYNQKGEIVGFMRQDLDLGKSEDGHWVAIGSARIGNKLFGQDVAEKVKRAKKLLVITEGQWDCVSTFQAIVDSLNLDPRYRGVEPFVVSIPLGTANAEESILQNIKFVTGFEEVCLFFDNDASTDRELRRGILKGKEASEAVFSVLVGTNVKLSQILAPSPYKDASDYLQDGEWKELSRVVSFERKEYVPEKVVRVGDIDFEDIVAPIPEGVLVHSFPELMEKTNGLHVRTLTLVTAPSGAGKTTGVAEFSKAIEADGHKLGMIFLEETKEETLQRMIAEELKVNYLKFKREPLRYASREKIKEIYDRLNAEDKFEFLDHFGSLPVEKLMQVVRHMHLVGGCRYIILDHLSMVISGSEVDDERKELDMVMTELAAFCASHDVGVIVVCHLNRTGTANQAPRLKDGEEPKPFWIRVTKESLRGSSGLEQLSFVILALEPEVMPDRSRGRVRWVVLKNRPTGTLGEADYWKLNETTWEVEIQSNQEF